MAPYLLVGLGGFFGSVLRYTISLFFQNRALTDFPWNTLTVNIIGSLIIGFLIALDKEIIGNTMWLLIVTGLLGGFTTYSAFSSEMIMLFKHKELASAFGYLSGTLVGGLSATALGYYLATWIK